ncbi:MAG TPA: hypothetical protein VF221_23325, partial [Chloroflexota bacterium]
RELDRLDTGLTSALNDGDEAGFRRMLGDTIRYVREHGTPVAADRVVASEVIIPPEDTTLDDARQFFTDEGLMAPLPA